jgi:PAT family beta-lactamase induction signal transducer AmpG
MLPGLLCSLLVSEGRSGAPPKSLGEAVVLPFREFIARGGWGNALWVLGFIFLYKLGDSMATALATKFYIDLGFSMTEIGVVSKTTSLWASVAGGIMGGIWMVRLGINRGLWVFGVCRRCPSWVCLAGPCRRRPAVLAVVIGLEAFGVGPGDDGLRGLHHARDRSTLHRHAVCAVHQFDGRAADFRQFFGRDIVADTGWLNFF